MTDETPNPRYFTVVDAIGWPSPAMEYWAAVPDEEQPITNAPMPMRRFIRLIGSGEGLAVSKLKCNTQVDKSALHDKNL